MAGPSPGTANKLQFCILGMVAVWVKLSEPVQFTSAEGLWEGTKIGMRKWKCVRLQLPWHQSWETLPLVLECSGGSGVSQGNNCKQMNPEF